MEKTADLAMIQKTNIDALHKEGMSQRVILKGVAVYRVLYQSISNAKLTGRKNLGRKRCTGNRDQVKSSLLYCQFFHMYSTYIQRIEIALLSDPWCIQLTLNTDSRPVHTNYTDIQMRTL